jgi:hypothetical protein
MSTFRKFWETRPRTDYFEWFNDFLKSSDYTAADWTITNGGSPTNAIDTDGVGGLLVLTTGGTDTNSTSHQDDIESFKFTLGKALEFEARFSLNDVVDSIFAIGLVITDTTPVAATDQLVFIKADTESTLSFQATADGSAISSLDDFATLVNNTFVKVGFYYDGKVANDAVSGQPAGTIDVFLNDRRVGSVPVTNAPDTELCVTAHVATGKTGAVAAALDYIRVIQER